MKELSVEQKAKRYGEALEKIKKLVSCGLIYEDAAIQVFPELKESEDMTQRQEWYAIKDGYKYQNYGLCSDGLYHWEKDLSYAGFTAQEMIDMGAE